MKEKMNVKLCNRVSALLMALLVLCQFMPYWHYGAADEQSVSVNEYVWFPYNHNELTEELVAHYDEHFINQVAWPTAGLTVLCALGAFVCFWKSENAGMSILPLLTGLFGLWFYLTTPAMKLGSIWWLHVLVLALMTLTGIAGMVMRKNTKQAKK